MCVATTIKEFSIHVTTPSARLYCTLNVLSSVTQIKLKKNLKLYGVHGTLDMHGQEIT